MPKVELLTASRGFDGETCWTQARAGLVPGNPAKVVLTMQKIHLAGSDDFEAVHSLYTLDGGLTWSKPIPQAPFERKVLRNERPGFTEEVVCDFYPQWHASSGTLLGTGHTAYYVDGHIPANRPRQLAYATYDPDKDEWRPWRGLEFPDEPRFINAGAGCVQRVDLPNGEILMPFSFQVPGGRLYTTSVARCGFDGETLKYLEHGSEHTIDIGRGLYEPSLTEYQGKYYLTLRNDEAGYIAVSEDGLNYSEPIAWKFDDGEDLGNYNTQQHWIAHSSGLYLLYTRRGLNNDHVFRHRAPIVMAQVCPERLCVLRDTEITVIPERGARLGNFGVTPIGPDEFWVTETEWMQNAGPSAQVMMDQLRDRLPSEEFARIEKSVYHSQAVAAYGSDNSVWVAKVLF